MRPVPPYRCFIGWDAGEMQAHLVSAFSLRTHTSVDVDVYRIAMGHLQAQGLYRRPTQTRMLNGKSMLWDVVSDAPMTTSHAIARFFVPLLCDHQGWALFADGDILVRQDLAGLFALADPQYAVMVVKHQQNEIDALKKDGMLQTAYARKNWSSVMLWNCAHPAHRLLTIEVLNGWPGRDLHAFNWLPEETIGALPAKWNHLVGVSPDVQDEEIAIAHYTLGTPNVTGHENDRFASEWWVSAKGAGFKLKIAEQVA